MAQPADEKEESFSWDAEASGGKKRVPSDPAEAATYRLSSPPGARRTSEPVTPIAPAIEPVPPRRVASKDSGSRLAVVGYSLLIFLTSACVMTLELTASRIIGKHLGASLYTWTSVIGVILAGITLGNWFGGWLADRFDRHYALGWMYLLSSVTSAGVLGLEQAVDQLSRPAAVSWPLWVLTVVALLFLLPAVALGATSPLIAALALSRSRRLGATVGNVYAWGAFGSIVGTFLTGFYLVDRLGSRAIIALIAVTLALLSVLMAGRRRVFRVVVIVGWLQFFLFMWTAASATRTSWEQAFGSLAEWSLRLRADETGLRRTTWQRFGGDVGQELHELGLAIGVRDDQVGRYYDESQYSFIHVADAHQNGVPVKVLRLDKLIHSYYDPAEPTALHYDYEKIYAAVTKVATEDRVERLAATIAAFPGWDAIRAKLPPEVRFDETTGTLSLDRIDAATVKQLLALAPDSDYWDAVEHLSQATTRPGWGGVEAYTLERLPEGVVLPEELSKSIRYDEQLRLLNAYEPITAALRDRLIQLSPRGAWYRAVQELRGQSGKISAFCIGGGGYIFPRWLAQEYPGCTRIDVAELDPAVREAVVRQMGLTPEDERRIVTTIGDARQVVDERIRENRRRAELNEPPITYDFIYGDAFNDFSVPWHLTTLEFQQKLKQLLSPAGIVQVNLIDIYPRSEYPGKPLGKGETDYENFLPNGLMKNSDFPSNQFVRALPQFGKIEVNCLAASMFRLRATEILTEQQRKTLLALDPANSAWAQAVHRLVNETQSSEPFEGDVPQELIPAQLPQRAWSPAASPFEALELQPTATGKLVLAYRGGMSDAVREKLRALAPQNDAWREAVGELQRRSLSAQGGQMLSRYVYTATQVFPNVYVFGTSNITGRTVRDTFIIVCALRPLNVDRLDRTGYWSGKPFAVFEAHGSGAVGHMDALLTLSGHRALTDDFAPVENLLLPIFARQ